MNWRVHRISTNRTFKQFMNAGYRSNGIRTQNIIDICSTISMLCGRKLMMWMDLIFIHAIWGCHTLNVIQLHQLTNPSSHLSKRKTPTYQNRKFYRIYYLGIPPFQFPSPNPLNFPISSPQKLIFSEKIVTRKRKRNGKRWGEGRRGGDGSINGRNSRNLTVLVKNRFFSSLALFFSLFSVHSKTERENERRTVQFLKLDAWWINPTVNIFLWCFYFLLLFVFIFLVNLLFE